MMTEADRQIIHQPAPGRFWRWSKRGFKGLVVFIFGLLLTGTIYQFAATGMDERKYQPPGKMVDAGGYRLHLNCTGEGAATVVMDAGLGGGVLDWSAVQPEVSKFTRVCTYDRAGMGWSERGAAPRTSQQIAAELHTLLANAGVQAPFVLVGHSLAGITMQLYASRYGDEVAGMVLVDSSHENQLSQKEFRIPAFVPPLTKALSLFGVGRLINNAAAPNPNLLREIDAERKAIYSHTGNTFTIADEMTAISGSMEQLRAAPMNLGDKPLIVISRGKKEDSSAAIEESDRTERAWRAFQTDLAGRSTRGKQIIAERSGHYIQFDQPELVIDAIRQVVEATGR
jgi:pimeloyl-ACP methyl ester carboxylesterase